MVSDASLHTLSCGPLWADVRRDGPDTGVGVHLGKPRHSWTAAVGTVRVDWPQGLKPKPSPGTLGLSLLLDHASSKMLSPHLVGFFLQKSGARCRPVQRRGALRRRPVAASVSPGEGPGILLTIRRRAEAAPDPCGLTDKHAVSIVHYETLRRAHSALGNSRVF